MNILEILLNKNLIKKGDIAKIEKQASSSGKTIEDVLGESGISADTILDAKGEYYNIPTKNLEGRDIPFSILKYVSEDAATHYGFIPIALSEGALEIGILDPENIEARDAISFIVGKLNLPYKIFVISEKDFKKVIESYNDGP